MPAEIIEAIPIVGALGTEILGVDLSKDPNNESFDAIHQALLEHNAIFFRNQNITPDQQLGFATRFGDTHLQPYMRGLPDNSETFEILKTETDPHNFGGVWHTDQVFAAKPAMGTALFAKEIPDAGDDTLFANMCAAYDASQYTMQSMLSGLKGICIVDRKPNPRAERYKDLKGVKLTEEKFVQCQSEHPLVCTHPEPVGNPCLSGRMWKPSLE